MTLDRFRLPFATLRWLLIPIIALHNFEEWLTLPIFGEPGQVIARTLGIELQPVPWPTLQMALILVTIVPALAIGFASIRESKTGDWLICAIGSVFLVNVFAPHLPTAVLAGGYSPGLVTAVGINLPFVLLLLAAARREKRLTRRQVTGAVTAGAIALPLGLFGTLQIAKLWFG